MTIPTLPSAPLVTDIPADFNTKAFNWVAALDNWTTEANATGVAADADAATATSAAGTATTQAGTATTQAGIATSAASTATTQAGIATTKAGEANASAVAAAASAASINLNSIDINGGTIDGTVIGGTAPAAVSATTLSASGAVTAQNGVTFGASGVSNGTAVFKRSSDGLTVGTIAVDSANSQFDVSTAYSYLQLSTDTGEKGLFGPTGLAVTGALSASGQIQANSAGAAVKITGVAASPAYMQVDNTAQSGKIWRAGYSGGSGGSANTFDIYDQTDNINVGVFSSTGLAVTGALSATGEITANNATTSANTIRAQNSGNQFVHTVLGSSGSYWNQLGTGYAGSLGTTGNYPIHFATNSNIVATLDASGNLGLGVTPSAWGGYLRTLDIGPGSSLTNANSFTQTWLASNAYYDTAWKYKNTAEASYYEQAAGSHKWFTAPSGTAGNAITFTQAMTLDANGNLLVGQTASGPLDVNGVGIAPAATGGIDYNHTTGTASGVLYARFNYAGAAIGSITQSGTTAVLYNTTSDARLKENITDASDAASLLDALQVRQFDWKADGSHQRYGFVAQELYEVAPEAVCKPQDPDEMMAVDYSKLVPMLVKEIQSLRQRVAQLEGI